MLLGQNRAVAFNQPNSRDKGFLEAWSGDFLNNTAHSNVYGLQLYKNGFSPAHGATYRCVSLLGCRTPTDSSPLPWSIEAAGCEPWCCSYKN